MATSQAEATAKEGAPGQRGLSRSVSLQRPSLRIGDQSIAAADLHGRRRPLQIFNRLKPPIRFRPGSVVPDRDAEIA